MRIPREYEINGNLWRVKFTKRPGGYCGETEVDGCCCPDLREIHIATGLDLKTRWETLVHELIHAIEAEYKERFPSLQKLLDHKLIRKIEAPIAAMLLDSFASPVKFGPQRQSDAQ